jgi:hypothetical protein
MTNGSNDWGVTFGRISFLDQILRNHGNVANVNRERDILFTVNRRRTADSILPKNRVSIEVRPCSSKTLRGPTFVCVACDEIAFWYTSVDFANPDVEVLASVRPAIDDQAA